MGAFLALLPRSNLQLFIGIGWMEVPSMYFIVAFFCYNVLMSVAMRMESQQVAYQAHVAGMLFGFLIMLGLLSIALVERQQFDFLALAVRWYRRREYRRLVRSGYDPFSLPPAEPQRSRPPPPDPLLARAASLRAQVAEAVAQRNLPLASALFRQLKAIDPRQCLPRQAQLDVANQLASEQLYSDAADAYEQFLRHYPNFDQIEEVELMLGLIYARYLDRYARAKECLTSALRRLHGARKIEMARAELSRIEPMLARTGPV